jgi:hypothetical protein
MSEHVFQLHDEMKSYGIDDKYDLTRSPGCHLDMRKWILRSICTYVHKYTVKDEVVEPKHDPTVLDEGKAPVKQAPLDSTGGGYIVSEIYVT